MTPLPSGRRGRIQGSFPWRQRSGTALPPSSPFNNAVGDLAALRPGLIDDVEGRLGGPAEPGEARVGRDPPDGRLARLCAERVAAWLGKRARDAELGGEVVVDPADRVQVAGDIAAGSGSPMSCRQSNEVIRS